MATRWLMFLLTFAFSTGALSTQPFPPDLSQSIDTIAQQLQRCYSIPSIAIALVDRRTTPPRLLARAYGASTHGNASSSTTLFPIGSISKSFTALAFAHLIDNSSSSSLLYSTPLRQVLGKRFSNVDLLNEEASIADVLAHRTGLAGWPGVAMTHPEVDRRRLLDEIHRLPVQGEFRSSFLYNNLLYFFNGALLERMSGKEYEALIEELFKEEVLGGRQPVFLDRLRESDDTAMAGYATLDDDDVRGYRVVQFPPYEQFRDGRWSKVGNPAGGLLLSVEDMARYVDLWINAPTTLGPKARRQLAQPQAVLPAASRVNRQLHGYVDEEHFYTSLAMAVGRHRGRTKLSHGGDVSTCLSRLVALPDERFGLFATVTGPGSIAGDVAIAALEQALLDLLFNGRPTDWTADQLCTEPTTLSPSEPKTDSGDETGIAEEFSGEYENELLGVIRVDGRNVSIGGRAVGQLLVTESRDVFEIDFDELLWPDDMNAFDRKFKARVEFERRGEEIVALYAGWIEWNREIAPVFRRVGRAQSLVGFLRELFGS